MNEDTNSFISRIHSVLETRRQANIEENTLRTRIQEIITDHTNNYYNKDNIIIDTSLYLNEYMEIPLPIPGLMNEGTNMELAIQILSKIGAPTSRAHLHYDSEKKEVTLLIDLSNL